MSLLQLENIVFSAGERTVLNNFSLTIEQGEVHCLLGANGTGKSTLAYLVMGCEGYCPASGTIAFEGTHINIMPLHERARLGISLAWQEPVRFEGISVDDYITLKDKTLDPAVYLKLVGLNPNQYSARMVDRALSGGERKRIELASILALKPKLAILDEPDSGIDMLSLQDIINVITEFRDTGSAVLLITHRDEIAQIADKASQICNGTVVCQGTPEKVAEFYKAKKCLMCKGGECVFV